MRAGRGGEKLDQGDPSQSLTIGTVSLRALQGRLHNVVPRALASVGLHLGPVQGAWQKACGRAAPCCRTSSGWKRGKHTRTRTTRSHAYCERRAQAGHHPGGILPGIAENSPGAFGPSLQQAVVRVRRLSRQSNQHGNEGNMPELQIRVLGRSPVGPRTETDPGRVVNGSLPRAKLAASGRGPRGRCDS
eukprot:gene17456-biopygen3860